MSIYVDGQLDNSNSYMTSEDIRPTENLFIGKHPTHDTCYFNGVIDEIKIYNRALSADEIKEHYETSSMPYFQISEV